MMLNYKPNPKLRNSIYNWLFVGLGVLFVLLFWVSWPGGIALHTGFEVISSFLAVFIGVIALVRFFSNRANIFLLISAAFLGAGVFDAYHAIITAPFFASQIPSALIYLMPWTWFMSRVFLSSFLAFSWIAWKREASLGKQGRMNPLLVYGLCAILAAEIFLFFQIVPLGRAYFPEFVLSRPQELIAAILFLAALIGYRRYGSWKTDIFEYWLVLSLVVSFMTQLLFIASSHELFDTMFNAAHVLKIISYLFVLTGIIGSMYELFRHAEEGKELFARQNAALRAQKEKLEEARAQDDAILNAIGDGLIVAGKEGNIVLVNRAFESLLGYRTDQVFGKFVYDVIRIQNEKGTLLSRPEYLIMRALGAHERTTSAAYYYVRKDGSRFPVAIVVTPIIIEGVAIGAVEVFKDITEAKAIDQVKSELVSLASHELRTPLSTMRWYIEMLLDEDAGKLEAEQRKYLQEIYRGNQRMIELIRSFLNVSRIELGKVGVVIEEVDLAKLVREIVLDLQPIVQEKHLVINEEYSKTLPRIKLDPNLIRIVMRNLITNAAKYTPNKGSIRILITKEAPNIKIVVSDTGYGIPYHEQGKIFTKLFRADNIRTKDTNGSGLGLYVTKAIVEESGGKIWFESEEGRGTKFYVTFPLSGMQPKQGASLLM